MDELGTLAGLFLWGLVSVLAAQICMLFYQFSMWAIGRFRVKREADRALLRGIKQAYRR